MKPVFNLVSLISFLLSRPSFVSFEFFFSLLYFNLVGGTVVREKKVGAGNGGVGGGEGVAILRVKIKTASIPRLVVVPQELIFFCKQNQI